MTPEQLAEAVREHAAASGLRLLVLHGSRARGDAGAASDWDLGYLADEEAELFDPAALVVAVTTLLGTDAVDLVDLAHASALLRYRAARDGAVLLERPAGEFLRFRLEAVHFWCDAGPVIRAAQHDVLASLP